MNFNFFTASGDEGEGDDLWIHLHPRPSPSRGGGKYFEEISNIFD
jgi:hypothetical protein